MISLRATDEEHAAWLKAAGGGRNLPDWLRDVANAAVAKPASKRSPARRLSGDGKRDVRTDFKKGKK